MATMSIGKAWEEAVAFVSREKSLLFPVALLFVALPGLIIQEMTPPELAKWTLSETTMPQVPGSFWLAMMLAVIIIWFGSLTLFALALRPGISVGEALRLSFARLPVLLGVALVVAGFLAGAVIAATLVVTVLSLVAKPLAATLALLLGAGVVAVTIFASVRLLLLNPVVIDGTEGDGVAAPWLGLDARPFLAAVRLRPGADFAVGHYRGRRAVRVRRGRHADRRADQRAADRRGGGRRRLDRGASLYADDAGAPLSSGGGG